MVTKYVAHDYVYRFPIQFNLLIKFNTESRKLVASTTWLENYGSEIKN